MKAAIISLGSTSSKWTAEAMRKYFDVVDEVNLKDLEVNISGKNSEVLYQGNPLKEYDCIYAKGSFRYAPLMHSITSLLKKSTFMPLNAESFTIAHDKLLTQLEMQQEAIPMPRTYLAATTKAAKKILEKMNYPVIMKFPQGTQGKGILFADSYASASSMLDALSALNQPFILQEYVETGGTDIRAIVVGDKVVASMQRKADVKEVRANVHAGGKGEAVELDAVAKKVAIQAARAIGAEICGVDILIGVKGPLVIEVNISPGLQGVTGATGIDVADKIARFLYKRTLEEKEKTKSTGTKKIMNELKQNGKQELITTLDFRGSRILIPEILSLQSNIKEADNVHMTAEDGKIVIKKFNVS